MAEQPIEQPSITIHNKISSNYRPIHVDGAFGGLSPRGLLSLSFFSERFPIPKSQDFQIVDGGKIGEKITDSSDSKTGIVREYEIGIFMDIQVAKELVQLLNDKVQEFEKLMGKPK